MTEQQLRTLNVLRNLRRDRDFCVASLDEYLHKCYRLGVPVDAIAEASGLSRSQVFRRVKEKK